MRPSLRREASLNVPGPTAARSRRGHSDGRQLPDVLRSCTPGCRSTPSARCNQSFEDDLALWAELGVAQRGAHLTQARGGWDKARKAVLDAGLTVSSMSCYRAGISESLEFSASIGAPVLYIVAGSAGSTPWEDAAAKFCEELAPRWSPGRRSSVWCFRSSRRIRCAPTSVSCTVSATPSISPAWLTWASWSTSIRAGTSGDSTSWSASTSTWSSLVQISDYRLGTFNMPNRCAIGDGDVPVERLMGTLLEAGYEGPFELEILGPRIDEEGYRGPIARSIERTGAMLEPRVHDGHGCTDRSDDS